MGYRALYRTYRPQSFNDVKGQEHITTTLKNALISGRISHAYLFTGPRGTGKTSIAKIMAKAVNCEKAPVANPCNECPNCVGITKGEISDVIEIDAASNNGVDEIREIRDRVKYLPSVGRYKVYIIDEVHMLSTGAFNALLKTLEEPPKHVIFILCTTEPQKVPSTIQSRCQRFDFRGINDEDISKQIREIANKESIDITDEAVIEIAALAEGGMRDALSLFDQVISYSTGTITIESVNAVSGTVSAGKLFDLVSAITESDISKAISLLDELIEIGKEVPRIIQNLICFFRDLLIYKNTEKLLKDTRLSNDTRFYKMSKEFTNDQIFKYIDVLTKAQQDTKFSPNPKLYLELSFIKMADIAKYSENILKESERKILNKPLETKKVVERIEEKPALNIKEEIKEVKIEENFDKNEEIVFEEENNNVEMNYEIKVIPSDVSNTYNIHFVENVLNNPNRQHREGLNNSWNKIKRNVPATYLNYASILEEGKVVASNGKDILIVFDEAAVCNLVMKPENKKTIKKILEIVFSENLEFMALPENIWEEKSKEFISDYKKGLKNIKLTPIVSSELRDVSQEEKTEDKEEITTAAQELFGDLVVFDE